MKLNKNNLLIILFAGILLLVIAIPTDKTTKESEYGTNVEKRLEVLLSEMEGVGEAKVMITFQEEELVEGIAVIAQGGGDSVVIQKITEVIQALFDIEPHKIKVIKASE